MKAEPVTIPLQLFQIEKNIFTNGPSIFGDSPEYTFIKKDTIRELHYTDNSAHMILADYQNPKIEYWQTGSTKTSFVEVDGKKVRIRTKTPFPNRFPGHPIVVLEAGFGSTINSWGGLFGQIGEFIPVIAYDRPGIGESEYIDHIPTDLYYAEHLKKLLTIIGAEAPYVVVGHSYGCDLIRVFADQYPEETAGLVLIDPVRSNPSENLKAFISIGKDKKEYDNLVDFIYDRDDSPLGLAYRNYEKPFWKQVIDKDLPKPKDKPLVLLYAGQKPTKSIIDEMPFDIISHQKEVNKQILKRLTEWMHEVPEGEMIIIPSSSHFIHRDEPEISLKAVKNVVYPDIARGIQRLAKEEGIEEAIISYYKRKAYYPVEYFNEDLLNQIGYKFIRSEQFDHAIAIFQLNVKEYPNEPNPHDSLGDSYRLAGDLEQAVECYSKAAEIAEKVSDPRLNNYRKRFEHYQSVFKQK